MNTPLAPLRVTHVVSGDLWAGAEAQVFTLLSQLSRVPQLELGAIVLSHGTLAERLTTLGVPTTVLDERRLNSYSIFRSLRRQFQTAQPHILHTHRYKENILGALAASRAGRAALVKTVHGTSDSMRGLAGWRMSFYQGLDRICTRKYFHRVICVSRQIREELAGEVPAERLVIVHNGVDVEACKVSVDRTRIRRALGLAEEDLLIGTAGRLVAVKGYPYLIDAAVLLRDEFPTLRCIILGDGPDRLLLQQRIDASGQNKTIELSGFRSDVWDLVGAMDVFVLPSLGEGIPMIILEAMALGTPIVATRVGGIPEILEDGQTALLVPPRDSRALAAACRRLLQEKALRENLAGRARERVCSHFSAQRMARDVFSLYESLSAGRP